MQKKNGAPKSLYYHHREFYKLPCGNLVAQKARFDADTSSHNCRSEIWKGWEDHLGSMCEEVEACAGATKLVEELAKSGIPMAIATSSRYAGVEKKRKR